MNMDEYKYLLRVEFTNAIFYYNSGHYMLCGTPDNGTRYKTKEAAKKDLQYATCEGGKGKIVLKEDIWIGRLKDYKLNNNILELECYYYNPIRYYIDYRPGSETYGKVFDENPTYTFLSTPPKLLNSKDTKAVLRMWKDILIIDEVKLKDYLNVEINK